MNNRLRHLPGPLLFLTIWAVSFFSGRYMLFVQEQKQLFQNDWHYIKDILAETGGAARVLTEAVVQFYHLPSLGVTLLTIVAMVAVYAMKICLERISASGKRLLPLSVTPVLPLIFCAIACEDTFPLVAYALTVSVSACILRYGRAYSWVPSLVLSPVLYFLCGSAAMLLPVLNILAGIAEGRRYILRYCLPALVYAVFGVAAVRLDWTGDAVGFCAYRYPMYEGMKQGSLNPYVMSSWLAAVVVAMSALLAGRLADERRRPSVILYAGLCSTVVAASALWLSPEKQFAINVGYGIYSEWAKLHYLYENERYEDLLELYDETEPSSSVESNYINLALYRTGMLTSDYFRYMPKWKHLSLRTSWLDMQFPFPYIWVETCDEMGALAKARQAAFEGNVMAGPGGSAPMVRYLALNDIVRGDYVSADKYLSSLENTIFYRKWASGQRRFLSDEAVMADSFLSSKRKCLYDEDRTLFDMNDLWLMTEVAKNSPMHRSTFDYTGIMVLSAGELNTFVDWMLKMTSAGVVTVPLPPVFQDAMVMAFHNNPKALELYRVDPARLAEYKEFTAALGGGASGRMHSETVLSKNRSRVWYYIYALMKGSEKQK